MRDGVRIEPETTHLSLHAASERNISIRTVGFGALYGLYRSQRINSWAYHLRSSPFAVPGKAYHFLE